MEFSKFFINIIIYFPLKISNNIKKKKIEWIIAFKKSTYRLYLFKKN